MHTVPRALVFWSSQGRAPSAAGGGGEGSLASSSSALSSPPSSAPLACLTQAINGEPASGQEFRAFPGGPTVLHPQGAAGPRALGSLFIYIYSLWKPNPGCTCPGPQAPRPCPGWTCGLSLRPGTYLAWDGGATGPEGENMSGPVGAGPAPGPLSVPRLSLLVPGFTLSTLSPANLAYWESLKLPDAWVWILPWAQSRVVRGYRHGPRFRTRVPKILHRGPHFSLWDTLQPPTYQQGLGV